MTEPSTLSKRHRRRGGVLGACIVSLAGTGAGVLISASLTSTAAAASGFVITGSLSAARAHAMIAALPNGEVLVAGGLDGSGAPLATVELYQPATGQWSAAASLPLALADAAVTTLANGDVLVAGGLTGTASALSASSSSEIYDVATGKWSTVGSLPAASFGASMALLPNGETLYAGGEHGTGTTAATTTASYLFDTTSGHWNAISGAALPFATVHAATATLANGDVLVAGGQSVSGGQVSLKSNAALFQPTKSGWTALHAMPVATAYSTATLLNDGTVLLAGGESATNGTATATSFLFNPTTGTWTSVGALPLATYGATATLLASGEVLYAGGLTSAGVPSSAAELYDESTHSWSAIPSLLVARAFDSAIRLSSGTVLIVGGETAGGVTASSELYPSGAAPAITSAATMQVRAGIATSFTITTSGTPTPAISLSGSLPSGLSFHDNGNGTATISGTTPANSSGSTQVTLVAHNGQGSPAVQSLRIEFVTLPQITSAATMQVQAGVAAHLVLSASGSPTPALSITGLLPSGLSFHDNGNGTASITGVTHVSGAFHLTVVANNGVGSPVSQALVLNVAPPPTTTPRGSGYWYVTNTGVVYGKGGAAPIAPVHPQAARAIVAMAATHSGQGYYLISSFGGVFNYGDATWYGSIAARHLPTQVVGFALDSSGAGYYLVTRAGNVFTFGDARWYGSTFRRHLPPITAFALTPDGRGYWLVTGAGNIYNFGDARFFGSPARNRIPPVRGFAPTPDGQGYWVVTVTGNVLTYGDAGYVGSLAERRIPPVTAFASTLDGQGYWVVTSRGNVFNFGDARWFGSSAGAPISGAVTGFAPRF